MKELKNQLKKLFEKKKKHQAILKKLGHDISHIRTLRDKENEKVKGYKRLRSDALKKVSKLSKKLFEFQNKLNISNVSDYYKLKKEYEALEWKYQTEVFSPRVEKKIVAELDELERRMLVSKEVRQARKEFSKIRNELKKARDEANNFHELVVQHANESEKHHKELLKLYSSRDSAKEKLKELDNEINLVKSKLDEEYSKIKKENKQVKKELSDYKKKKDEKQRQKLRKRAVEALEKLKKGKKVTIEEFALIEEFGL